ncbi:MAG TPA: oligosaccharide flippase family protein [Croceibacterium sp.]|nr:oligosaccharide flippase family protein [Croceibacterium sp.]
MAPMLNVALRVATLGTRFALIFVLARYLDVASVGYYGLFTAAIGYALLCVGLDLYVYTTREIAKTDANRQGHLLKNQAALVVLLYFALTPLAIILLPTTGLPKIILYWFIPILFLEHINQELYRLLIILHRQIAASTLLFIRQGSWALAITGLMIVREDSRNLTVVMAFWATAGVFAAAAGLRKLHGLRMGGWRERIDWRWIRNGIGVSGAFLAATMAIRGVQTFDRYWLEDIAGIEVVGAYVLFFGIASALNVFLDAAIFSFRYPELIRLSHEQRYTEMRSRVHIMALLTIGACLAFSVASSLLLPILLSWIGEKIYLSEISLYYWVLAAMISYSLSMVPHYALYARGNDRTIIASHLAALPVFGATTWLMLRISPSEAVPAGVFVAMTTVLMWKTIAYLKTFYRASSVKTRPERKERLK